MKLYDLLNEVHDDDDNRIPAEMRMVSLSPRFYETPERNIG